MTGFPHERVPDDVNVQQTSNAGKTRPSEDTRDIWIHLPIGR